MNETSLSAVDLSRDHKPDEKEERRRIESLGGVVRWFGLLDRNKQPIPSSGVYRINGKLALSRALGR